MSGHSYRLNEIHQVPYCFAIWLISNDKFNDNKKLWKKKRGINNLLQEESLMFGIMLLALPNWIFCLMNVLGCPESSCLVAEMKTGLNLSKWLKTKKYKYIS